MWPASGRGHGPRSLRKAMRSCKEFDELGDLYIQQLGLGRGEMTTRVSYGGEAK